MGVVFSFMERGVNSIHLELNLPALEAVSCSYLSLQASSPRKLQILAPQSGEVVAGKCSYRQRSGGFTLQGTKA